MIKIDFFEFSVVYKASDWSELADNFVKWSKMIPEGHNYWFGEIWKKISKISRILGVVTDFQIENFYGSGIWRHFLRLDSDRPSWGLQFEPYDGLEGAWDKKLLRNYEIFMTKS